MTTQFHHAYTSACYDWAFYRASYEGGRTYLERFLDQHPKELDAYWQARVKRAVYPNAVASVIDTYVAHVYHEPVSRPSALDSQVLTELHNDINLQGDDADEFYTHALAMAMVYGAAYVVVDRFDGAEHGAAQPETRAQELEAGRRPYATVFTPERLVDWQLDMFGNFMWAIFREDPQTMRSPLSNIEQDRDPTYKLWTKTEWHRLKLGEDGDGNTVWMTLESGTHPVGEVPVVTIRHGHRVATTPHGQSAIKDLAPMNRRITNLYSLIDEQTFQYVFSILVVPDSMFDKLKSMNFSVAGSMSMPDTATHKPFYLGPDIGQLEILRTELKETMREIRVLSGIGRQNEDSRAATSGRSMAFATMDKTALLKKMSERMTRAETRVDAMALAWMEETQVEVRPPVYNVDFNPESVTTALEDALMFDTLGIGGVARLEGLKLAAQRHLSELPDETMLRVMDDIETRFGVDVVTPAGADEALNGIQVRAMVELVEKVGGGVLTRQSASAILQSAFGMDEAEVQAVLADVTEPAPQEPIAASSGEPN